MLSAPIGKSLFCSVGQQISKMSHLRTNIRHPVANESSDYSLLLNRIYCIVIKFYLVSLATTDLQVFVGSRACAVWGSLWLSENCRK